MQGQKFVLLHPEEFRFGNGWELSLLQAVLWAPHNNIGKNTQAGIITSVFSFDDCFFTHN